MSLQEQENNFWLKGTVCVILPDPPCKEKDSNARFTTVPLKPKFDQKCEGLTRTVFISSCEILHCFWLAINAHVTCFVGKITVVNHLCTEGRLNPCFSNNNKKLQLLLVLTKSKDTHCGNIIFSLNLISNLKYKLQKY